MNQKSFILTSILAIITFITVACANANFTPPQISNFRVEEGQSDRIYFDSDVPIIGSTIDGFSLIDKGGLRIVDLIVNSGQLTGHYFEVSSSFSWYHNNTFRYEGGSDMQDNQGNKLAKLSLQYIKNNIPIPEVTGVEYYVNVEGDDSNEGLTEEAAFKTIQRGIDVAKSGDKVWIKSGNYGDEGIETRHRGRVMAPITFEGYKEVPGDITNLYYSYGYGNLDASEMPLIDGGDREEGVGLILKENLNYNIFKNIQIQNYQKGVIIENKTSKIILERIICKDFGSSTTEGVGFALNFFNNSYLRLKECFGLNGSEGVFKVNGSNNLLDTCKAYGDAYDSNSPQGLSPDYYLELQAGSGNIVRNMHIERAEMPAGAHTGHAYSVRYNALNSLFENNKSVNIGYNLNSRDLTCTGNVWRNIEVDKGVRGIVCDGDGNVYENIYIHDTRYAIALQEGKNTIFKNILIDNVDYFIFSQESGTFVSQDIKFYNLTINKVNTAFMGEYNSSVKQTHTNIQIKNSIISNCATKLGGGASDAGFVWDTNNFHNTWGVEGSNTLNIDPMYVDVSNKDFRLQTDSPMIDVGLQLKEVSYDYDKITRLQGRGYNLGAFAFQSLTMKKE